MRAPFIGRADELALLRDALGRGTETGGVVVSGDPGGGKTRLVAEAIAGDRDRRVLYVRGHETEAPVALAAAAPLLIELAALPVGEIAPFEPIQIFERAYRALASGGPVAIVVDDLQWVDDSSFALCQYVIRGAAEADHAATALAFALSVLGLAASSPTAASPGRCYDPVPDPFAAGWAQVGTGVVSKGTPLGVADPNSAAGQGLELICADPLKPDGSPMFGSNDIVLSARFAFATTGNSPASDGNTGVQVTINDGTRMVRAYVIRTAQNTLKVVLAKPAGSYSNGFEFPGTTAAFRLVRRPDGRGRLELANPVAGQPPLFEEFAAGELADSARPNTKTLEFGSDPDVLTANNTLWDVLGLPPVPACRNTPSAILAPINADGSSAFKLGRTIPVKARVTDCNGSPVDTLAPELALLKLGAGGGEVNEVVSASAADAGTTMRSAGDGYYQFNLSTKQSQFNAGQDLSEGRYRLTLSDPSFAAPVVAEFDLRS